MSGAWRTWARTDVGAVRTRNEDAFVERPEIGLWAVADGAGGHEHGEVASGLLASSLGSLGGLASSDMVAEVRACVMHVHRTLRAQAEAEAAQTGGAVTIASTIVVFLGSGPHYACLWAGDSRGYRLRAGALAPITRDHSLVQALVDQGTLTEEQAERHPHANVITRAVGAEGSEPELDKVTGRAQHGDRYLLCSDGLTKTLPPDVIARLAAGQEPARALVGAALEHGVRDNVTAVVLEYAAVSEDDDSTFMIRR